MSRSNLSQRIVTGVIGAAALLLLLIFGDRPGASILAAILSLGMIFEFAEISFSLPDKKAKRNLLLLLTLLIAGTKFRFPQSEYVLTVGAFLVVSVYFLVAARQHVAAPSFNIHFHELMFAVFGLLYVAVIPLALVDIRSVPHGLEWVILFFLIVWSGDTGAYFVGKALGRHKLYALISPKKTVEGAVGGLVLGVLASLAFRALVFPELSLQAAILIPIPVGIFAQLGDLCESFLKRAFNKKDSGSILPGHGGFLDRFDGLVFGLPIMYACMRLFGV